MTGTKEFWVGMARAVWRKGHPPNLASFGAPVKIRPRRQIPFAVLIFFFSILNLRAQDLLVPMDEGQRDHLKAYGLTSRCVQEGQPASWLLNVRGGSFLLTPTRTVMEWAASNGVTVERLGPQGLSTLRSYIGGANAAEIKLEKFPRIAVYTPPQSGPWADAVTLVLQYAGIPYTTLYDRDVLGGDLSKYDWLHLHHEDFTGQHGKFWSSYRNAPWYIDRTQAAEGEARALGFASVPRLKGAVARRIQGAVQEGLFLFAMCAATETLEVALATQDTDIAPPEIDGTPVDPNWAGKLHFEACFAFTGFTPSVHAYEARFSDIDFNQVNTPQRREVTDFTLFEFSAKLDPVPTLLNQSHQNRIAGFFGQTSTFRKDMVKDGVTLLAESVDGSIRYLHGNFGKGAFTYYGGHAPEDRSHYVGDKAPEMLLHRHSAGFRLILNNVLFPSAKPPKKKT